MTYYRRYCGCLLTKVRVSRLLDKEKILDDKDSNLYVVVVGCGTHDFHEENMHDIIPKQELTKVRVNKLTNKEISKIMFRKLVGGGKNV